MRVRIAIGLCALSGLSAATDARPALFDFESVPSSPKTGALTLLTMGGIGGTVSIYRVGGTRFDVVNDDELGFPEAFPEATWGNQALTPFFAPTSPAGFIANFSASAVSVSIEAGDFGQDVDLITLEAFSGPDATGIVLDSDAVTWSGNMNTFGPGDDPVMLSVTGVGIRSIAFSGGAIGGHNTMYFDNLSIAFPCPANIVSSGASATQVDIDDLLAVISAWGSCPAPPAPCPADIAQGGASAGVVDIDDLLAVISAWGACP